MRTQPEGDQPVVTYDGTSSEIIPDSPRFDPPKQTQKKKGKTLRERALTSLDSIFIDGGLKDDIIIRTSIPELFDRSEPSFGGVMLYGPPGTGKTAFLRAIVEVYKKCGAYTREIKMSAIDSMWASVLAKNLDDIIQYAIKQAGRRRKPSFLLLDEGARLAQDTTPANPANDKSSINHYQEGMDVLHNYLGNQRNLVMGMSSNLTPRSFHEALIREGRLAAFYIGYPNTEQRMKMWKYFSSANNIMELDDRQAIALADSTPKEQGAFIEEFCRSYEKIRKLLFLKTLGYSSVLEALKGGASLRNSAPPKEVTFEVLIADVLHTLQIKYERQKEIDRRTTDQYIGFRPPR